MESYLFADVEAAADTMVVEGYHKPGSLTRSSGAWIHAAGTAMFEAGRRPIKPHDQWIWFAVEAGEATLVWQGHELTLKQQETCFLPAGNRDAALQIDESVRCVWIALEGPLAPMVVRKMGALLHMPLKQGALPSQMYLAKQIVQVIVRHTDTSDATYQLQHLMYGSAGRHGRDAFARDCEGRGHPARESVQGQLLSGGDGGNFPYADGNVPQALRERSGHAAAVVCAALQDGTRERAAA